MEVDKDLAALKLIYTKYNQEHVFDWVKELSMLQKQNLVHDLQVFRFLQPILYNGFYSEY